jgi:hypothetical protein
VASPLQWGSEDRLRELFAGHDVDVTRQQFTFRYPSPQAFFDAFRTYYGPVVRAWEALDEAGRASFEHELVDHAAGANRSGTALAVPSDYLEVVVTKA